jgi:SMC interacting uncharacterized protein involved in chromosome segregation
MSEDLTQKLPKNNNDSKILTAIKDLEKKVDGLEKKVDERLHDTRPIWHKVVADIAELQSGQKRLEEGQKRLEEGQQAIHSDITDVTSTVNNLKADQRVINDAVRRMQLDFITVNEWLHKLTVNRDQQNSST